MGCSFVSKADVMCIVSLLWSTCSIFPAQTVPGVHDACWITSFISFVFLYPSTFNLLEVRKRFSTLLHVECVTCHFGPCTVFCETEPCHNANPFASHPCAQYPDPVVHPYPHHTSRSSVLHVRIRLRPWTNLNCTCGRQELRASLGGSPVAESL